jgi:hypothetical protein
MYCPRCGQQQVSGEVRFCSRCGFHLGGVEELLATGGLLPVSQGNAPETTISPRQKGVRFGVKLLLLSLVLLPFIIAVSVFTDSPAMMVVFFTLFLSGLSRMLYARFFEEASQAPAYKAPMGIGTGAGSPALPPWSGPPVASASSRGVDTRQVRQPPSVTESTTNLLDREKH